MEEGRKGHQVEERRKGHHMEERRKGNHMEERSHMEEGRVTIWRKERMVTYRRGKEGRVTIWRKEGRATILRKGHIWRKERMVTYGRGKEGRVTIWRKEGRVIIWRKEGRVSYGKGKEERKEGSLISKKVPRILNLTSSLGSVISVEAGAISSGPMLRQCILAKLADVTPAVYQQVASQGAAAMVVILPANMTALSPPARELVRELEIAILELEVPMAVYFAQETPELVSIYKAVKEKTSSSSSAAANFLSSLASDGYQMVVSGAPSKQMHDVAVANVQGQLNGLGVEDKLPSIALVAHYDAFGAAPELSFGADSNGSGVAALLEIARLLSRLYKSQHTHPHANVFFLLPGGGFLNYQGTKRFLDDLEGGDASILGDGHPTLVLCLDSLTATEALHLHVSRPPKNGTLMHAFYQRLVEAGEQYGVPVKLVHRKIDLVNPKQVWQHHLYSIKKLPAATLSALPNGDGTERGSITDTPASVNSSRLVLHTATLHAALLRTIYGGATPQDMLSQMPDTLSVSSSSVMYWLSMLASQPRSTQLLQPARSHPLMRFLYDTLNRYTVETKLSDFKPDKRDPDFGFYDNTGGTMTAYSIKPATFDFFLSIFILSYLGVLYLLLQQMPLIQSFLLRSSSVSVANGKTKTKHH
ncbi:Nicastrin [Trinorchestia longiramus]|nr:Nicastrin [Trinorchestia longiramus]